MATIPNTRGNPQASDIAVQTALPMVGSSSREDLQSTLGLADSEIAKLFEDRNIQLTDGGLISFLGTSVQFTQSLKLHINSKVAGTAPTIIDLGSTTRNVSADGRMIYAVVDRTAGTATVTDDSTILPAVTSTSQEVFLIAKRVDSPDGIKRIYFRNGSAFNEGQSARLGSAGSGSGSGSGLGDDLGSLTFKASISDTFAELSTDILSTIDYSANKTDTAVLSLVNQYARLNYDASKTVAAGTTTTNLNISAVAAFTVKIGDFAIYGTEVKRITAVATQASFTTEAFSVAPTVAGQVTISQGVYTKDLNNFSGDGLAPSTAFTTTINQILVNYEDTTAAGDIIFDANTSPVIAYSASSDGTTYSALSGRSVNLSDSASMLNLPSSGTNLFLRFVANKTSGSGAVNLLSYKAFFHRDQSYQDGTIINQAYCFTDGTGTEINCATPVVVSGKTRVVTTFAYPLSVNLNTTNGSLSVYLNGQKIPRFVDSVITPDAYYKEIDTKTIELDGDYSTFNYSLEIVQSAAVVDISDTNVTSIGILQEAASKGFQGFVDQSSTLTATTTTGTPAAGTFYSTIVGRKPIVDLTADLKPRMGIERVATQNIYQLQDEFGANGEPVWGATNDALGQIRFVGNWTYFNNNNGQFAGSASTNDYVEITFYGTGLNLIPVMDSSVRDLRASVDGGAEGSNIHITTSPVLSTRNLSFNSIVNAVSGLTLGIHTVKIRAATSAGLGIYVYGFEILNDSSTIKINPGSSYIAGKKYTTNTQQSINYNTSFESGSLGVRGGRVLVYQKFDGTIAKAVQPVDLVSATLASTNHANEEIARTYHFREFGAGRADDFSSLAGTSSTRAFTLDDGTTTLIGDAVQVVSEAVVCSSTNNFLTITFVGTGLDLALVAGSAATSDIHTIFVDGTSVGTFTLTANQNLVKKIVSGLPYGTHTVKFQRGTAGANGQIGIKQFVVYQPKKPTLPTNAIELADYNVMADFITGTVGTDTIATGVLRKFANREFIYAGTWATFFSATVQFGGTTIVSSTTNDYIQYSFFGTGFEHRFTQNAASSTWQYTIDGSTNLSSFTTSFYGAGVTSFTAATGTLVTSTTSIDGNGVRVSGLPLGLHTVKITKTAGTGQLYNESLDVITPIYSVKSNVVADYQNTLTVGSNAISDNRKLTAVKDSAVVKKNWVQAVGVTSGPTTTSTTFVPMPDMSTTIKTNGGDLRITANATVNNSSPGSSVLGQIYLDGVAIGTASQIHSATASVSSDLAFGLKVPVSAGFHKVDIYWRVGGGTGVCDSTFRTLLVEEI